MKLQKRLSSLIAAGTYFLFASVSLAQGAEQTDPPVPGGNTTTGGNTPGLRNPVTGNLGNNPTEAASGQTFVSYFISIWQALISIGAILVIIYFLWGALEWITAGGDSGKVANARNKIVQAIIGMIILVGSFIIIGFISMLFFGEAFNILQPTFLSPNDVQNAPTQIFGG